MKTLIPELRAISISGLAGPFCKIPQKVDSFKRRSKTP